MKKIVLVDGNNLLFRSYYATLYTGNIMRNKDGFPTNGVYGFVNMINKIVNDEKPEYMMVAFDIGKTFRHEKYERYKDGRKETPDDLKVQFPIAKKILAAMGITRADCTPKEMRFTPAARKPRRLSSVTVSGFASKVISAPGTGSAARMSRSACAGVSRLGVPPPK